jgi:predicted phage gp36 major capsid-like protein
MATKKRRSTTARNQKPITATRAADSMNLCEVAERIAAAKKELRDRLRELEEELRVSGGNTEGSKEREKLEVILEELDELLRPVPPIHIYC